MRLPFVALFSIVVSMACTGYAHSDHDLHAREFVNDLSSRLSEVSTRDLVNALSERLERRANEEKDKKKKKKKEKKEGEDSEEEKQRASPRWCCPKCGKEFPNGYRAKSHQDHFSGHIVRTLAKRDKCWPEQ
ncbi:hypothetical protein DFP72DRAFT_846819 [Ephemerocybe angulata]|uniref:C2H2-type domain-containing protein n=1 Tax=Ephemerocybe angulata TaxID=980116 RepID=A0A8H6I0X8_9AGAR|nr:hypothetical protein DFP72DRAFT_846819 [Tulosesus angulatus]